jgi:hypothetical protein
MKIDGTFFINKDKVYRDDQIALTELDGLTWSVSDEGATLYYISSYVEPGQAHTVIKTVQIADSEIHGMLIDFIISEK